MNDSMTCEICGRSMKDREQCLNGDLIVCPDCEGEEEKKDWAERKSVVVDMPTRELIMGILSDHYQLSKDAIEDGQISPEIDAERNREVMILPPIINKLNLILMDLPKSEVDLLKDILEDTILTNEEIIGAGDEVYQVGSVERSITENELIVKVLDQLK